MIYNKNKLTSTECLERKALNTVLILAPNCIIILKLQKHNNIKEESGGGNICNIIIFIPTWMFMFLVIITLCVTMYL